MPESAVDLAGARSGVPDPVGGRALRPRADSLPAARPKRPIEIAAPGEASEAMSIRVVRDVVSLRELEVEWQELADEACEPNPFYEPWAALPALEAFGDEVDFVLVSRPHPSLRKGEEQLCGLFPVERRRASGPFAIPMLSMWRHLYVYLGVPLVRAGLERAVMSCFLDWLAEGRWHRSLLRVEDLPGDGPLRIALVDELSRRGWTHTITQTYTRAFLRRAGSAESYVAQALSGKKRKEYRRQLQRLGEHGVVELCEPQTLDDPRAWARAFVELESRGWKGREAVGIAAHGEHVRYFTELVRHATLRGRCMALSLRVDGRPVAMKLNLLSRRGSVAFKITYDEQWARYSPGVLLELENIQRVHARDDIPWMDSCAAPNRLMINRLWTERREMQTVLIATDRAFASLVVSAMPPVRWISRMFQRQDSPVATDER